MERWFKKVKQWVERWRASKPPAVRRVIVGVIGVTLLLVGIAMIILPGPAFVVIPLSLAVLATEFVWARRALQRAKGLVQKAKEKVSSARRPSAAHS